MVRITVTASTEVKPPDLRGLYANSLKGVSNNADGGKTS